MRFLSFQDMIKLIVAQNSHIYLVQREEARYQMN
jgi:hypothetical protein